MPDDHEEQLLRFVRRSLITRRSAVITPDTPLFERKLIDSMNILRLIGYVERALGRRLRHRELVMSNFRSVRTIVRTFLNEGSRSSR